MDPSIPGLWPRYSINWKIGDTRYRITVLNPDHQSRGVRSAEIDGTPVDAQAIPLLDDGRTHEVVIVLGQPRLSTALSETLSAAATRDTSDRTSHP